MAEEGSGKFPFAKGNWILFGVGIGVIALGYVLLSIPPANGFWSLTAAPVLLVTGYCVIVPLAILLVDRGHSDADDAVKSA